MSVFARVKLEVEVELTQPWSNETSFTEVQKRALDDARTMLMQGLVLDGLKCGPGPKAPGRILDSTVTAIIVTDKK